MSIIYQTKVSAKNHHLRSRWAIFIWERHNPFINVAFSILFFLAHFFVFGKAEFAILSYKFVALLIGVIIFLFKLRLFDEIKDFEHDAIAYPHRPLVRGAILHPDIYQGIALCTLLEFLTFGLFGWLGLISITIADTYAFLMFKEFFVRKWIRPKLILYAVTHTFVIPLLSLAIISVLSSKPILSLGQEVYIFAAINWLLFNVYEFGRKSFIEKEENQKADSYSKNYGRAVASVLVGSNGILAILLANKIGLNEHPLLFVGGVLVFLSILFTVFNRQPFGKLFRMWSFFFLITFYLASIINHL